MAYQVVPGVFSCDWLQRSARSGIAASISLSSKGNNSEGLCPGRSGRSPQYNPASPGKSETCRTSGGRAAILELLSLLILLAATTAASALRGSVSVASPPQQPVNTSGAITQKDNDARELEPGKPIERELAGGASHSYRLTLASGQYARLIVDQRGIDVLVTVYGPNGEKFVEMDSPNGAWGQERVSLIAETSGSYQLEARSLEKEAIAGRYEVRIEEVRAPTPQDNSLIAAQRAYAQGMQLLVKSTAESLRESVAKFEEALPLWRAIGDREGEANTLNCLSKVYYELGERKNALDLYIRALSLYRVLGDRAGEKVALNDMGVIYNILGEGQKALDHYTQALALDRALGDRAGEATTLMNIGLNYKESGENQMALDHYGRALTLHRAVGNRRDEANTLLNIGALYNTLGDRQKALDYYDQSLPLHRAVGNRREEATTLGNMGAVYQALDENQKALDYYNQALTLARSTGNRSYVATLLNNIGAVNQNLGANQKAFDHYSQALAIHQATVNRRGESLTLNNIGMHYAIVGEDQQAFDYYNRALLLRRATSDRSGEAFTLYNIARLERRRGNLAEARNRIEESLAAVESLRADVTSQQLRASFFASIRRYHELHINLLMGLHKQRPSEGFDSLALEASEKSRARSLLELLKEARAETSQGVDPALIERERALRRQISDRAERQTRLLSGRHTEEQAAAAAREMNALTTEYEQVQAQIRHTNPRYAALTRPAPLSLKQIQTEALDPNTLLLEYALGEEKSYLWAVTQNSIHSFELPKRAEIEAAARRVYELVTARNQLAPKETPERRRLRVESADAEYSKASAALSQMLFGPVASQLGARRLLVVSEGMLQYMPFVALPAPETERRGDGATGRRSDGATGGRSDGGTERRGDGATERRGDGATERRGDGATERRGDGATERRGDEGMGRLGDGERGNRAASRSVAPSPRRPVALTPLIAHHEIISLPSASVLVALRRETAGRGVAAKTVAVLADPVFDSGDPRIASLSQGRATGVEETFAADVKRSAAESGLEGFARLRFSRQEAEQIARLAPEGEKLKALDFAASRAAATSAELGQYRIVHFATHGLINSHHPELSGIVLSLVDEQGRPQNGFLRLYDVYNLKLGADLVVLSACQTALGKEVKGEGLIGLTRGFMYAGAPRVAASLWRIDDRASAELMKRFYQRMLGEGMSAASALRAAQVSMWREKRWEAPYHWAGFTLQGEWR